MDQGFVDSDIADRLVVVLKEATPWNLLRVEGLVQLSGGVSRETWSFDAVERSGDRHQLILQRLRDTIGADNRSAFESEFEVLGAAKAVGVPVAQVVTCSADPGTLGLPFLVTERIAGEALPQKIFRDDQFDGVRDQLAEDYGVAVAKIQQIPLRQVPSVKLEDPLENYRRGLDQCGEAHPALELGLRWLEENRPPTTETPVVVHGDFRNSNGIIGDEGLKAVIDWELVHLGDPLEDIGWFCLRAWRYGRQQPAGGFGTYDQFIGAYERAGGREVNREAFRWWQIAGSVRWGVICIQQALTHLSGRRRSIELAAVGRRACEAEFDLMLLLP